MNIKSFFIQRHVLILSAIILLGAFLRFYQFEPWLHFELDQSRDARVVDEAYGEGSFLDLPLLGPKAGGTFLRLGPAFYYLQYVSGLLFGETPSGIAFFIPILSTLVIAILYLFFRRAFTRFESLWLTLLFTVSVYVVLYARFAWNPNLLIFFLPVGFYALLRAVDKKEKYQKAFFLMAVVMLTLATQFHFLAFLALPLIVAPYLLLKRPRYPWRTWFIALIVTVTLYVPMILNEFEAGFTNAQEFIGAVTEKSTKESHTFLEKAVRDATEYSQHGIVILTGYEGSTFPSVIIEPGRFGTVCDAKCDQGKWYGVAGLLVSVLSLLALVYARRYAAEQRQKDFYDLIILWFAVSYLLFFPLAYGVAPRFYLLVTPLFFVLLGILIKVIIGRLPFQKKNFIFGSVILLFCTSNIFFLYNRFSELERAKEEQVQSRPDRILKEQIRVTLEQQMAIVDFLKMRQDATGYPIYMFSDPQYRRALKYLMEKKGIQNDVLGFSGIYREGEYYLIFRQRDDYDSALRKYRESYEVGRFQPFGTLMVIPLTPKEDKIQGERQDFSIPEKPSVSKAPPRYTWREWWQNKSGQADDEEDNEEESNE